MESIDKLREYAAAKCGWGVSPEVARHIKKFADAIEREVEQLRDREYQNGREDARDAVEFADRLCRASERREDVTLWGVDYMPLPVDADGVPIHVGDVMDSKVDYLFDGRPFGVRALVLCDDGWEAADGRFGNRYEPDSLRHHHAPTVEDVLREMLDAWGELPSNATNDAIVAEYASKLRLAGDE